VKGWLVAWTSDLGGLMTIDDEVRDVFERAVSVFHSAGAQVEAACPDLSDVPEIVRLTRGLLMVARHADKLPEHRAVLQEGLVENTEQGLALTSRDVARGELLRTRQWQRVREFLATRDLLITPTSATPPFPIENPHPVEINGRPVGRMLQRSYLTYAFSGLHEPGAPGRPADRRPAPRRSRGAARGRGLRGGAPVGGPYPADRAAAVLTQNRRRAHVH